MHGHSAVDIVWNRIALLSEEVVVRPKFAASLPEFIACAGEGALFARTSGRRLQFAGRAGRLWCPPLSAHGLGDSMDCRGRCLGFLVRLSTISPLFISVGQVSGGPPST